MMSSRLLDTAISLVIYLVVGLHLIASPYTKVEESFNIQATHDILKYGVTLQGNTTEHITAHYDHVTFPGSVPRTFSGALLLAGLAQPLLPYVGTIDNAQMLIRGILGFLIATSLVFVRLGVDTAYGKIAGRFFVFFITSQFHVMYYASRTLPNIFAFGLTNTALALLLFSNSVSAKSRRGRRRRATALYCLTVAGVVFRSELAILLLTTTTVLVIRDPRSFWTDIVPAGAFGLLIGLSTTYSVDSIFWRRWTWPELEGFYFNTILGKSSEWGTSPFYFYYLNALPRLLINPIMYLICIAHAPGLKNLGISQSILLPQWAFIFIYSFMPHKEWRFVMYTVPAFTAVAAGGAAWIWNRRAKSVTFRSSSLGTLLSTAVCFAVSMALLWISSNNYPGGQALQLLHRLETAPGQRVHLDNLACQTGVTRFLQVQPTWTYDKTENATELVNPLFWQHFDYVIVEDPKRVIGNWQIKDSITSFDGISTRLEEHEEPLPISDTPFLAAVARAYNAYTRVMRTRLTGGRWPTLRFKTKLYILEREHIGLKEDLKLTIQM